jgi:hypothetical protein
MQAPCCLEALCLAASRCDIRGFHHWFGDRLPGCASREAPVQRLNGLDPNIAIAYVHHIPSTEWPCRHHPLAIHTRTGRTAEINDAVPTLCAQLEARVVHADARADHSNRAILSTANPLRTRC